jgi:lipopolysaccharide transport system permease protein
MGNRETSAASPSEAKLRGRERPEPQPTRVIRPASEIRSLDLGEVWRCRDLILQFALRDVQLRYRQTMLGIAWAVVQPLLTMAVFAFFFGRLGGIPSEGLPYALFALVGLVPWQFFQAALLQASNSLVDNHHILRKASFPRIAIPLASIGSGLLDLAVSFVLLAGALALYRVPPRMTWFAIAPLILLALVTAVGTGLWLSSINVRFRDVRYTMPFLAQIWLLSTPVAYPATLVPDKWRTLLALNPMTGVVEGFRWALVGSTAPTVAMLATSSLVAVLLLATGLRHFRLTERGFADEI